MNASKFNPLFPKVPVPGTKAEVKYHVPVPGMRANREISQGLG